MPCLTNSVLWLKGGVWMEQERQLEQTEDELYDLAGQIMALAQTMMHSSEEEQMLAALQEWEDQLMIRAKDLSEVDHQVPWQGISAPWKLNPKGFKWEPTEKVE